MQRKILSILICLSLTITSFVFIERDKQVAAEPIPDCILDENYINSIATYLSSIINSDVYSAEDEYNNVEKGRFFNSKGEREAAQYLNDRLEEINVVPDGDGSDPEYPCLEKITRIGFTDSLDIISEGLYIDGERIIDFYIAPRWNLTAWWPFPHIPLEERDKDRLSTNFSYEDPLEIRRPAPFNNVKDIFSISCLQEIDQKVNLGIIHNESTFYEFVMEKFANLYDFTWEDLNDSDSETWPNFIDEEDVKIDWPPFVFIVNDTNFNENYTHEIIHKYFNPLGYANMFWQKVELFIQMRLWKFTHPTLVGVVKYNFDHTTYNMQICSQSRLPVININRDEGEAILNNTPLNGDPSTSHITRLWINQDHTYSAESYNVIGKIIGTDTNHEVLVDCLYDSWWNQGAADSAIGVGIVLAIAKFFNDTGITPKRTIKFALFSGEEYAKNGAEDYYQKHHQDLTTMIDLNQLGFRQTGRLPQTFFVVNNHPFNHLHFSTQWITELIVNDANYPTRSNSTHITPLRLLKMHNGGPSDTTAFAHDPQIDTILFVKDLNWTLHHRDGLEHTAGDSMEYIDQQDTRITAEMIWNVTKYFTMWPECSFPDNPTYITEDSANDDDTNHDTVKATIAMESILPQDRVRVKASLTKRWAVIPTVIAIQDFTITDTMTYHQISVTLPPYADHGNYHLTLQLLNSTARINDRGL